MKVKVSQSCPALCDPMDYTAMTNVGSIIKNRDIILQTAVHLVKAIVSPVVMYGCESWIIKKAECRRIDALNCGVGETS